MNIRQANSIAATINPTQTHGDPFAQLAQDVSEGDVPPAVADRNAGPSAETIAMMAEQGFVYDGRAFTKTTRKAM